MWIDNITITDSKNNVRNDSTRYEFTYDDEGRVASVDYYLHGSELDHVETYEYDEYGNVAKITYRGASSGVYLQYFFTYEMVEAGDREPIQLNGYQAYFNLNQVLEGLL